MNKVAIRWVIVGVHGLYTGQWHTRREAIWNHCKDTGKGWIECRINGDRAIKARISYTKPK